MQCEIYKDENGWALEWPEIELRQEFSEDAFLHFLEQCLEMRDNEEQEIHRSLFFDLEEMDES